MKKVFSVLVVLFISYQLNAQWKQANGPYGGYIYCLTANGNNIFAGTQGGVYLSTNNGIKWTPVNDGLNALTTSLTVQGSYIFASTGDENGLYLSTNNGTIWAPINKGLPSYPGVVTLAFSDTNIFAASYDYGIYLSTDKGLSWTQKNNGLSNPYIVSLAINGSTIFAGTNNGMFLSTNNGTSWAPVYIDSTNTSVNALCVIGNNIFAGTGKGVYISTNNGASWTQVNNGLASNYFYGFAVSGNNILAASGGAVYLSQNNGANWTNIQLPVAGLSPFHGGGGVPGISIAISGTNIFVGTSSGMFISTNCGLNWNPINEGLTATFVNAMTVSGDNIYAVTNLGSVYLSTDKGDNWGLINMSLANTPVFISSVVANDNYLFAGTGAFTDQYLGERALYRSSDNGKSWSKVMDDLIGCLAVRNNNIYAAAYNGLFISTNYGAAWTLLNTDIRGYVGALLTYGENILVGDNYGVVYLSTDNGTNWTQVQHNYYSISSLAGDSTSIFFGTNKGLFHSTNNINDWKLLNNDLPETWINTLVVDGNNVITSTYGGVYLSTNNGTNWTKINSGLPNNIVVGTLTIIGTNVIAGTNGAGIWKRPLSELTGISNEVKAIPQEYTLFQNYPNPFNPSTAIKYAVPFESNVNIRFYNSIGQVVREVNEGTRQPGNYEINFNSSGLASGIYFYSINAVSTNGKNDFSAVKKMILLK